MGMHNVLASLAHIKVTSSMVLWKCLYLGALLWSYAQVHINMEHESCYSPPSAGVTKEMMSQGPTGRRDGVSIGR
jgi:hypothetical protein